MYIHQITQTSAVHCSLSSCVFINAFKLSLAEISRHRLNVSNLSLYSLASKTGSLNRCTPSLHLHLVPFSLTPWVHERGPDVAGRCSSSSRPGSRLTWT